MKKTTKRIIWGLFWVAIGAVLLLSNYGIIAYQISFARDWPVVFILIGLSDLIESLT